MERHGGQYLRNSQSDKKMSFRIESADEKTLNIIRELSLRIWPVAYAHILQREQIDYMLDQMYSQTSLKNQLNSEHKFFVAYYNNQAIGFASLSPVNEHTIKLQKLYVLTEFHGKGFGLKLLDHIVKVAREHGSSKLILNVNRYNKAIDFYERNGFIKTETVDINIGNGFFMNDYVMEKEL